MVALFSLNQSATQILLSVMWLHLLLSYIEDTHATDYIFTSKISTSLPVIGKKTGSPSDSTGTSIQMLYWSEGLVKYYNGKNNPLQVNRHNVCILSLDY